MNFATFYRQSIKDKIKKVKRGPYKGQLASVKDSKRLQLSGPVFYKTPGRSDAPSADTFVSRG
jgi:hypothetical protein